jgi:hypothetical protein
VFFSGGAVFFSGEGRGAELRGDDAPAAIVIV